MMCHKGDYRDNVVCVLTISTLKTHYIIFLWFAARQDVSLSILSTGKRSTANTTKLSEMPTF